MALKKVYLYDTVKPLPTGALPDIKYIGSPPALPVTVELLTEEAVMSDKSRRLAFFGINDRVWREWTLGWGYLDKTQLDQLTALVAIKKILKYENEFEDFGDDPETYDVYVVSFSYEFVRTGIRDLQRFRADMLLREV